MRSRPQLDVFLSPSAPRPGDTVQVRARLTSRSETPIRGVSFDLVASERRYSHASSTGEITSNQYQTYEFVRLRAVTRAETLGVGATEYEARFPIPVDAPPTFQSELSYVRYELTVEVDIPWWPNRKSTYAIKVHPPRWRAEPRGPRVYATHRDGPVPGQLYIEATVDPLSGHLGGKLRGAVSLASVTSRLRSVKLSLVAVDEARFDSARPAIDLRRYDYVLSDEAPKAGASMPFALRIPEDETPNFTARLMRVGWALVVRAEQAWSGEVALRIPLVIAPEPPEGGGATRLERLPPVGHERRAQAWAHVAAKHGMTNDPTSESMTAQIGDVALRVHLEDRDKEGLVSVGRLSWPDLGIDLSLRERRWSDLLRRGVVPGLPDAFEDRFAVACREPAQGAAFLRGELIDLLLASRDLAMDDEGALLATPGGGHRLEHLDHFLGGLRALAHAVAAASQRIPPPPSAAAWLPAFAAFAREHGGRVETGSLSIRGLIRGGVRFDLISAWIGPGELAKQTLEHALEDAADLESERAKVELEKARGELPTLAVEGARLVLGCRGVVTDPAALEPELTRLERLVKLLRGERSFGAYR